MPQSWLRRARGLAAGVVVASLLAATGCSGPAAVSPSATTSVRPSASMSSATPTTSAAPLPDPDKLKARLDQISRTGIGVSGVVVVDPVSGVTLFSRGDKALVPASSLKVLTAVAALDVMGAGRRFTTPRGHGQAGRLGAGGRW